ncbi:hypothetical protein [Halomonas sp. H2]|uniref:hypothetical protein n=1 Tax=unclassified Halomonas TaxID=2609666 RepID=UPI003CFA173F
MPLGTTPRAETACSASHARPTWPDEPSKLDRQQGFGYSSILDRGRLFFLYSGVLGIAMVIGAIVLLNQ